MRRLIPLLLLAGCWPRIPGAWDDYDTGQADTDTDTDTDTDDQGTFPDDGVLVGEVGSSVLRGDYWAGASDGDVNSSYLWWGVSLDDPSIDDVWGNVGACARSPNSPAWLTSMDALEGANLSELQGSTGTHALNWSATSRAYLLDMNNPVLLNGSYTLRPTATKYGHIAVNDVVAVPGQVNVTWPPIAGASPPYMDRFEFSVETSGVGSQDYLVVEILLVDMDNVLVDEIVCLERGQDDISVPPNVLAAWDGAIGGYLRVGVARVSSGPVQGSRGDNQLAGIHWQQGFFYTDVGTR